MKACEACGAEIPYGASFCPGCGKAQGADGSGEQVHDAAEPTARPGSLKRILVTVGVLALVVLSAAVATFLLSGRTARGAVVSLTSGRPIVGATISSAAGTATTDGSGHFSLPRLRLGTQIVTVTVDGFPPFESKLRIPAVGTTNARLRLPDSSVRVRVREAALQPESVEGAEVRIGGVLASRVATGTYVLKGLQPESADIGVSAAGHEATKTTLPLEPGVNDITIDLPLTAAETYARYFEAYRAARWADAYRYFHPDIKQVESLSAFTTDSRMWGTPDEMTVQGSRTLAKWTSPATNASYANVTEVRRKLTGKSRAGRYENTGSSYWVNVGGLWLRVDI